MLLFLLGLSAVFFIEPILKNYPDDARVFPQMMSAVVFIGTLLLLLRNYLPGALHTFVAEEVAITSDSSEFDEGAAGQGDVGADDEERVVERETIGTDYGYEIDDTLFMVSTAVVYFFAGWGAGFFFVTPIYVLFYTLWFKVDVVKSVFLAILATAILWLFMEYLAMPFDRGNVLDFSPFLPFFADGVRIAVPWGGL